MFLRSSWTQQYRPRGAGTWLWYWLGIHCSQVGWGNQGCFGKNNWCLNVLLVKIVKMFILFFEVWERIEHIWKWCLFRCFLFYQKWTKMNQMNSPKSPQGIQPFPIVTEVALLKCLPRIKRDCDLGHELRIGINISSKVDGIVGFNEFEFIRIQ